MFTPRRGIACSPDLMSALHLQFIRFDTPERSWDWVGQAVPAAERFHNALVGPPRGNVGQAQPALQEMWLLSSGYDLCADHDGRIGRPALPVRPVAAPLVL